MSTSDLFLSAFGGKEPEDKGQQARNVGDTTDLFLAAFGHDTELKNYTPDPILDYELNAKVGVHDRGLYRCCAGVASAAWPREVSVYIAAGAPPPVAVNRTETR